MTGSEEGLQRNLEELRTELRSLRQDVRVRHHRQWVGRQWIRRSGLAVGLALAGFPVVSLAIPDLPAVHPGDEITAQLWNDNFESVLEAVDAAVPVGAILPFAGSIDSVPEGFLPCDGSEVGRAEYERLFSAIGVRHGEGDGAQSFNLPDYRGQFLRGVSGESGRDPDAGSRAAPATDGSGASGNQVGSVQASALSSHTHGSLHATPGLAGAAGSFRYLMRDDVGYQPASNYDVGAFGGSETRPVNAYVHFIIRAS